MTVRMWITAVEGASLSWLDGGKEPPLDELRDWLVEQFVAMLVVSAGRDPQTAAVVRAALVLEERDGALGGLARAVLPVIGDAARLL
jgi:hypothetical protein